MKNLKDKKINFNFKIDKDKLDKLKEMANKEERTVASYLRAIIYNYIKRTNKNS